jgi:hypothetical protein
MWPLAAERHAAPSVLVRGRDKTCEYVSGQFVHVCINATADLPATRVMLRDRSRAAFQCEGATLTVKHQE